jgi:hypothetical protein
MCLRGSPPVRTDDALARRRAVLVQRGLLFASTQLDERSLYMTRPPIASAAYRSPSSTLSVFRAAGVEVDPISMENAGHRESGDRGKGGEACLIGRCHLEGTSPAMTPRHRHVDSNKPTLLPRLPQPAPQPDSRARRTAQVRHPGNGHGHGFRHVVCVDVCFAKGFG